MDNESGAWGIPSAPSERPFVVWNDQPLYLGLPVRRKASAVQTQPVDDATRRVFEQTGWPRDHVIMWEHSLEFVSEQQTILLITNAPHAAWENPACIVTTTRDLGTYRDALIQWRGWLEHGFASVRLTTQEDKDAIAKRMADANTAAATGKSPMPNADDHTSEKLAIALRVAKSGLIVAHTGLPAKMTDDDRLLANYLLARKDEAGQHSLSFAEIGEMLGCSDEAVRRRTKKLMRQYPELARIIRAFRSRNQKGAAPPPPTTPRDGLAPED